MAPFLNYAPIHRICFLSGAGLTQTNNELANRTRFCHTEIVFFPCEVSKPTSCLVVCAAGAGSLG